MSHSCDEQWHDTTHVQYVRRTLAHVGRVNPMRFRESSRGPVPLGQSSTPAFNRQAECLETCVECPPRGVYSGCIFEWRFGLGKNAPQELRRLLEKYAELLRALEGIAGTAGQGQLA